MRILKWLGLMLLGLIVIAGVLAVFNWDKLVRLNTVNTLFSEELIVSNFSNMDKAFFNVPVPSKGEVEEWQMEAKTLPDSFESSIGTKNLREWLEESRTTSKKFFFIYLFFIYFVFEKNGPHEQRDRKR